MGMTEVNAILLLAQDDAKEIIRGPSELLGEEDAERLARLAIAQYVYDCGPSNGLEVARVQSKLLGVTFRALMDILGPVVAAGLLMRLAEGLAGDETIEPGHKPH